MGSVIRSGTALAAILVGAAGCSQAAEPKSGAGVEVPGTSAAATAAATAGAKTEIARFTAVTDKKNRKLSFTRVESPTSASGTLLPQSINSVSDPTGVNGNPAAGTVDLVTVGDCTDGYPTTPTFSCNIELISGFTRNLANVYVQVSNVTFGGSTISTYDATNSSPELDSTNDGTLQQSHGLWVYGNSSVNAAAPWPVIGSQASGFNTATLEWDFANPGDENIVYTIVVYATEFWGNYTQGSSNGDNTYGNMGYTDACTGAQGTITSGTKATVTLPFDFTLFNTNSTTLNICTFGELTLGSTACVGALSPAPSDLSASPKSSLGSPIFFPFWEKLKFGASGTDQAPDDGTPTAGRICYQTLGAAPNRIEVVEWRNMDFTANPDTGSSLDFEAFLYEGTNEIDLYYENMVDGPANDGRAGCSGCFIGVQGSDNSGYDNGSTALIGVGIFGPGGVSAGTAGTFIPAP